MKQKKIVIIGNGIAGTTLALELHKIDPKLDITMISGESEYHYSRPALMYIFMGHMMVSRYHAVSEIFLEETKDKA